MESRQQSLASTTVFDLTASATPTAWPSATRTRSLSVRLSLMAHRGGSRRAGHVGDWGITDIGYCDLVLNLKAPGAICADAATAQLCKRVIKYEYFAAPHLVA